MRDSPVQTKTTSVHFSPLFPVHFSTLRLRLTIGNLKVRCLHIRELRLPELPTTSRSAGTIGRMSSFQTKTAPRTLDLLREPRPLMV